LNSFDLSQKVLEVICLPLTDTVSFKTQLYHDNRFQVPKLVRWEYKLETSQPLNVEICNPGFQESFLAKMRKDGRITVPALMVALLKQTEPDLKGYVLEITLRALDVVED